MIDDQPRPPTLSFARAALGKHLEADLAEFDRLCEECYENALAAEIAKADLEAASRADRAARKAEVRRLDDNRLRLGGKVITIEARIKRARLELGSK